jgi:hypothetical protein
MSAEKLTMIPYGADRVDAADAGLLAPYGLSPGGYAILIARAAPENSILEVVQALRFHARFYVHGHQVGGTNPSLVESLGTGNAVLAHDNAYNRWVAGDAGVYFADESGCARVVGGCVRKP